MSDNLFDVCIIGTGAGGGPVAAILSEAGLRVAILEKGPHIPTSDFNQDELKYIVKGEFLPNPRKQPMFYMPPGADASVEIGAFGRNPEMVGGSTVHYEARAWRFQPQDFRRLSLHGSVDGASLADWPISYDDLEPFYTQTEWEIGVSGREGENPFAGFRSRPFPCPPLAGREVDDKIRAAGKKFGLNPFHTPLAIVSKPYKGRVQCMQCGFCGGFGCTVAAKSSTAVTVIERAIASGSSKLIANAAVNFIDVDGKGFVKGVVYSDQRTGKEERIDARVVILSAGAIESARLLLHSTSNKHPDGLGNSSGLVGKNLMFHLSAWVHAEFPYQIGGYRGVVSNVALDDYYDISHLGLAAPTGGTCNFIAQSYPITYGLRAPNHARFGFPFKQYLRQFDHTLMCHIVKEEIPVEQNRVTLHPTVHDEWGVPASVIHHTYREEDISTTRYLAERMAEILAEAGGNITSKQVYANLPLDYHRLGTCRFGNDPARSVLNKYCQSHDVPNLFVVDGSFFPTSGGYSPSLTIEANSFRVGSYLVEAFQRGDFTS